MNRSANSRDIYITIKVDPCNDSAKPKTVGNKQGIGFTVFTVITDGNSLNTKSFWISQKSTGRAFTFPAREDIQSSTRTTAYTALFENVDDFFAAIISAAAKSAS
jgi:hypothetical protein